MATQAKKPVRVIQGKVEDPWAAWLAIYSQLSGSFVWLKQRAHAMDPAAQPATKESYLYVANQYSIAIGKLRALLAVLFPDKVIPDDTPPAQVPGVSAIPAFLYFISIRVGVLLQPLQINKLSGTEAEVSFKKRASAAVKDLMTVVHRLRQILASPLHDLTADEAQHAREKARVRKAWLQAEIKKASATIRETEDFLRGARAVVSKLRAELAAMDTIELDLSPDQPPVSESQPNDPSEGAGQPPQGI